MNAFGFILAAALLNIVSKVPAVYWILKHRGRYNNQNPRLQFQENPTIQRLYAAHTNTMEAFLVFAAGMFAAHITALDAALVQLIGWSYVASRIIYVGLYAMNYSWLRSTVWGIGWLASLAPLALAAFAI